MSAKLFHLCAFLLTLSVVQFVGVIWPSWRLFALSISVGIVILSVLLFVLPLHDDDSE
jgi:uncharacterized protein involved in exopolysaccharide biosynthesis